MKLVGLGLVSLIIFSAQLNGVGRVVDGLIESQLSRGSFRSILTPKRDLSLSSKAEGIIYSYHKREGDFLKEGDIILELNSDMEKIELELAEIREESSRIELKKAEMDFSRSNNLHEEKIQSDKMYENSRYQMLVSESRYKQAEKATEMARIRLEDRYVRSPIDGVFFKKSKDTGEVIKRFEVIGRVVDVSSLEATFYCGASYFGRFKEKEKLKMKLMDGPGNGSLVEGEVFYVDSLIDPASGTFRLKLTLNLTEQVSSGLALMLLLDNEA